MCVSVDACLCVCVCLLFRKTWLTARPVPRMNSWRFTRAVEWDGGQDWWVEGCWGVGLCRQGGREGGGGRGGGGRGESLLRTIAGLSGSHLQAWLNNRMLYENKNIICLSDDRERPLNWFPFRFCAAAHLWATEKEKFCSSFESSAAVIGVNWMFVSTFNCLYVGHKISYLYIYSIYLMLFYYIAPINKVKCLVRYWMCR